MAEVLDQLGDGRRRLVGPGLLRGRGLAVLALVDDPPDPAPLAVAAGVGEGDLVVADDPVVEVGDVEGTVGAELDVDRAEPGVVADDEVGLGDRPGGRAVPLELVVVDPAGDDVADEDRASVGFGEVVGRVVGDPADPGRAVVVADHLGAEAEAVVGLAEARVIGPSQELIDRPAVAVARIKVAVRVERQAEGVDLAMRVIFDVRAVGLHPVDVAGLHDDRLLVRPLDLRLVAEPVAGVDPAVEAPAKGVGHAVGVLEAVLLVGDLRFVGLAVAVRIDKPADVGDVVDQRRVPFADGQDADRDVQAVGEGVDRPGLAVVGEIAEHDHPVARPPVPLDRIRIFDRRGDPEPPPVVEGQVHRLVDLGLGGDQLDDEPFGKVEARAFVLGRPRAGLRDELGRGNLLGPGRDR